MVKSSVVLTSGSSPDSICSEVGQSLSTAQVPRPWYALRVSVRSEASVRDLLNQIDVTCYLPSYREPQAHFGRTRVVDVVLFPGYLFIQIDLKDRFRVIDAPQVIDLVRFGDRIPEVPVSEIEAVRALLSSGAPVQSTALVAGKAVKVKLTSGAEIDGIVSRVKDEQRVAVNVTLLGRAVVTVVDQDRVKVVQK